ncbi:hypothetical protein SMD44_01206 [Streptomyces alboflavus]|uniref:Uncharacterized protein n=1 Tax=Streptomyces alboflavus TaxID=67267 RepID=A0A1Z1W5U0_9ACTN|nr:hypothetical protein [Streptomyces alboflavus]ARX81808.1 hypothetical protein SMD44_01206 [Streptomyces alboflavus]
MTTPKKTPRKPRARKCPLCKGTGHITPTVPVTRGLASAPASAVEGQEGLFEVPDPTAPSTH